MDYLNTLTTHNTHIHNAVDLVRKFPVTQKLTDMYKRSSKNELLFIGAATYIALYNFSAYIKEKRQKLNNPPAVPYGLPIFGHSLYLIFFPGKFMDWCNEKYGEMYNLNLRGKTVTVVGGKSGEESMKSDATELSLSDAIVRDVLHLDYVFDENVLGHSLTTVPEVVKIAVTNSKMPMYVPGIKSGLKNACDALLKEKTTVVQGPSRFFQNFVAYMTVPAFVGDEFALNVDVIESFAFFTGDIIKNVGTFMMIPKPLHKFVLPYVQSAKKHHDCMLKYIAPAVRERRAKMQAAEEAGEEHGLVNDFLQGIIEYIHIDENGVESNISAEDIAHIVLLVAFASVHTTSMNTSFCIYWLLARPDLMASLKEEMERVVPGDSPVTAEALAQMHFLNNFIRESIRQGVDKLSKGRKAVKDYTFANGYQVPKGRLVSVASRQMNFGGNFVRNTIDGMDPEMSKNKPVTTPGRDFVSFGAGKHLCPGRFFAVQEIQMTLIYLLRNYDITTVSGKPPKPVYSLAGYMSTNSEEPLIFTRKN
ncbi:cytochrome P450 [Mucor mucedo]|uniref:cytochrome P450 n=1 Tax=Mucor mucedo TaxID=29922 RepID=UPI002220A7B7|nr:cytochrome P450 [Mucor mucedo]KAI7895834.1 cytochrome P450 [Mucor mucedo]